MNEGRPGACHSAYRFDADVRNISVEADMLGTKACPF